MICVGCRIESPNGGIHAGRVDRPREAGRQIEESGLHPLLVLLRYPEPGRGVGDLHLSEREILIADSALVGERPEANLVGMLGRTRNTEAET